MVSRQHQLQHPSFPPPRTTPHAPLSPPEAADIKPMASVSIRCPQPRPRAPARPPCPRPCCRRGASGAGPGSCCACWAAARARGAARARRGGGPRWPGGRRRPRPWAHAAGGCVVVIDFWMLDGCQVSACLLLSGYESALLCSSSTNPRGRGRRGRTLGVHAFQPLSITFGRFKTHLGENRGRGAQRKVAEGRKGGGAGRAGHEQ